MAQHNPQPRNFNGLYFILGGVVVALAVVFWLVSDDAAMVDETPSAAPDVTIQNEAPAVIEVDPAPEGGAEPGGDGAPAPTQ